MALVTVGLLAFPPFLGSLVLGLFARTCRRVQLLRKGSTGTLGFSLEQFRLVNRNFSDAVIISVVLVFAVSFSVCDSRRLQFSWKWQSRLFGEVSTFLVLQSIGSADANKLHVETCDAGSR